MPDLVGDSVCIQFPRGQSAFVFILFTSVHGPYHDIP